MLGTDLTLPVLRADGTEIVCRLVIDESRPLPGRSLFMAWIDPVEDRPPR